MIKPPLPRTPSDIYPTPEEEFGLLNPDGSGARWWLILENGTLADPAEQERLRPADATPCDGDWYKPWYNTRNHVHGGDRAELSWAAHAFGTRESVRAMQVAVLYRIGRAVQVDELVLVYEGGEGRRWERLLDVPLDREGALAWAREQGAAGRRLRVWTADDMLLLSSKDGKVSEASAPVAEVPG